MAAAQWSKHRARDNSDPSVAAEVRAKLGKLVPRLASEFEGERIATVAAIDRVLKAAGFDWFDFTRAIVTPASSAAARHRRSSRGGGRRNRRRPRARRHGHKRAAAT